MRDWDDAIKYGFVSAGGGEWYNRTLNQLFVGARVFAYIPHEGYVGVGIVKDTVKQIKDFYVDDNGSLIPILQCNVRAGKMKDNSVNPELSEYLVKVEWIKTLPRKKAYREPGMFSNQNTVCKLRNAFTLEKLYKHFEIED